MLSSNYHIQKELPTSPEERVPYGHVHKQSGGLKLANEEFVF